MRTAERLGVPCALCAVVLFGAWCVIQWFGDEIAKPLVHAHVEFLRAQTTVNERNAASIEKIADVEAQQSQVLEEVHEHVVRRQTHYPP